MVADQICEDRFVVFEFEQTAALEVTFCFGEASVAQLIVSRDWLSPAMSVGCAGDTEHFRYCITRCRVFAESLPVKKIDA
jgi:hypothetical protein